MGKQTTGTAVPVVYDVGSPRMKVPEALGNSTDTLQRSAEVLVSEDQRNKIFG